ncbi:MAG TPA: type III pantothenate kinase [Flavobacteriaceae bacterium]|jgi:type III pantothenate kinase|nr:type III pantothenate kinase [Flavobacteriaceae bacterium]HBS12768.1 type III pantothenate kinase [Flavobacteriaceae bacterium]
MNLILDIGNTYTKIAVFKKNVMLEKVAISSDLIDNNIQKLQKKYPLKNCIVSSVTKLRSDTIKCIGVFDKSIELNQKTNVPFQNHYKTPTTLGVDRIALASASVSQYSNQNTLVIDAGTCITYDFINTSNEYLGGAISPGISIRYKALHQFTANLPLLEPDTYQLIGKDTKSSIHSGVLNGLIHEVDGIIDQYSNKYSNLTVVLTGGDTIFLAKKLKSSIFANPNFLLEGLNSILIHNLNK